MNLVEDYLRDYDGLHQQMYPGEGHRAAAKRREWVRREGERREDAMKAHWVANVRERGVFRGNLCSICDSQNQNQ